MRQRPCHWNIWHQLCHLKLRLPNWCLDFLPRYLLALPLCRYLTLINRYRLLKCDGWSYSSSSGKCSWRDGRCVDSGVSWWWFGSDGCGSCNWYICSHGVVVWWFRLPHWGLLDLGGQYRYILWLPCCHIPYPCFIILIQLLHLSLCLYLLLLESIQLIPLEELMEVILIWSMTKLQVFR